MEPWYADLDVLLAIVAGILTVAGVAYWNRRDIGRVKDWAWGNERTDDEGLDGKLDTIAEKIDEEREERRVDHQSVRSEMKKTRVLVHVSVDGIVRTLNDELDSDVEVSDLQPEWLDEDLAPDGGQLAVDDDLGSILEDDDLELELEYREGRDD